MNKEEFIRIVYDLDHDQLVMLRQFLYQLTYHEEKRIEQEDPDPEEHGQG